MTLRPALALSAVLTAAALSVPAQAAPPAVACKLLHDGAGDASVYPLQKNVPSLDILSGDVATGRSFIVGVLRLATLSSDPETRTGALYSMSWSVGGLRRVFELKVTADGKTEAFFLRYTDASQYMAESATFDLSTTAATITWRVPRRSDPVLWQALKTKPVKLTGLAAVARPSVSINSQGVSFQGSFLEADRADGGLPYVDGSRSCVKGT